MTLLLHGGHLWGDAVLAGVRFDPRAAGGVPGQTRAALTAGGVHVQVITDVGLSVTLFIFVLLQLAEVFEGRLEAEVEAVAAAQVQEEVSGAER